MNESLGSLRCLAQNVRSWTKRMESAVTFRPGKACSRLKGVAAGGGEQVVVDEVGIGAQVGAAVVSDSFQTNHFVQGVCLRIYVV